ncbi:MAG TPA: hypothetical protein VKP88_07695 [Candidatus Paceibacterota bacterium]|nr:hypothetical protein [Candidatus Paceibacterota bacterium]
MSDELIFILGFLTGALGVGFILFQIIDGKNICIARKDALLREAVMRIGEAIAARGFASLEENATLYRIRKGTPAQKERANEYR